MKKSTLYILLITLLTLGGVSLVQAQDNGGVGQVNPGQPVPSQSPQEGRVPRGLQIRDRIENRQNESSTTSEGQGQSLRDKFSAFTNKIKGVVSEKIDARQEAIRTQVRNRFDVMVVRYESTLGRLQNIYSRTESRITKIKANGNDTSVADGYMTQAQTDLTNASTSLMTLQTQAQTLAANNPELNASSTGSASTTPFIPVNRDALNAMKATTQALTKSLNDARTQMMKAVTNLMKYNGIATSTPSNI